MRNYLAHAGLLLLAASFCGCPTSPPEGPLEAAFTVTPHQVIPGATVQFMDTSKPGAAPITGWRWEFGDGGASAQQHPQHAYTGAGVYDVSLTVENADGEDSVTVEGAVTVTAAPDTQAPQISLNGSQSVTTECGAPWQDPGAVAVDYHDPDVPVVVGGDSVNTGEPGRYELTYDATDDAGNAAVQLIRVVEVVDRQAPVLSSLSALLFMECGQSFTTAGVQAMDACAGELPVTAVNPPLDPSPGQYLVTYVAEDPAGNRATLDRLVEVVDTTPPVVSGVAPELSVECGTAVTPSAATAVDACAGAVAVSVSGQPPAGAPPGEYTLTYTAWDNAGNAASVGQLAHVLDTGAPVLTGVPPELVLECGSLFEPSEVQAVDDCDDTIDVHVLNAPEGPAVAGEFLLTYRALDSSGNAASASQVLHVVDTIAPEILLEGEAEMTIFVGETYAEPGARVVDACPSDIPIHIGGDVVDTLVSGRYTVTYDAVDGAGNAAVQRLRAVEVVCPPTEPWMAEFDPGDSVDIIATPDCGVFVAVEDAPARKLDASGALEWEYPAGADLNVLYGGPEDQSLLVFDGPELVRLSLQGEVISEQSLECEPDALWGQTPEGKVWDTVWRYSYDTGGLETFLVARLHDLADGTCSDYSLSHLSPYAGIVLADGRLLVMGKPYGNGNSAGYMIASDGSSVDDRSWYTETLVNIDYAAPYGAGAVFAGWTRPTPYTTQPIVAAINGDEEVLWEYPHPVDSAPKGIASNALGEVFLLISQGTNLTKSILKLNASGELLWQHDLQSVRVRLDAIAAAYDGGAFIALTSGGAFAPVRIIKVDAAGNLPPGAE
jgi:hypothetical protein